MDMEKVRYAWVWSGSTNVSWEEYSGSLWMTRRDLRVGQLLLGSTPVEHHDLQAQLGKQ